MYSCRLEIAVVPSCLHCVYVVNNKSILLRQELEKQRRIGYQNYEEGPFFEKTSSNVVCRVHLIWSGF